MPIFDLPNELLFEVVDCFSRERDINSAVRSCKRFYNLLNDHLYRHNIRHNGSNALVWATRRGCEPTARRLIHLGADTEVTAQNSLPPSEYERLWAFGAVPSETPLHIASRKGNISIVKLLLDAGADTTAVTEQGNMPLFTAIYSKEEKIARTIYAYMGNIPDVVISAASHGAKSPLHVASSACLPSLVQFFLLEGANMDLKDGHGRTALYYAWENECFDIINILLEFGADADMEIDGIPVRVLGVYPKVSGPGSSNNIIGRAWMSPSNASNNHRETLLVPNISNCGSRLEVQPPNTDSFPTLVSEYSSAGPALPNANGLWASSNTKNLLANLSISKKRVESREVDVDPFPQLTNPGNAQSPLASDTWRIFRQQGNGIDNIPLISDDQRLEGAIPRGKGKGKRRERWQPLKF